MNHLKRGTNHDQIDGRVEPERPKSWIDKLKEAQAVIAACAGICTTLGGVAISVVRWTVRDVVRAELAEVRATAVEAKAKAETSVEKASAVPQMRKDLDDTRTEQVRLHADISAKLNELVGADMGLREMDQSIQRRIDSLLMRVR